MRSFRVLFVLAFCVPICSQQVERDMVVLEIGTGTWCQFCPGAAMGADDLIENGHDVAVIEYHNGDDYTNDYSDSRIDYYGITGFPTAIFDGVESYVGGSQSNSMYSAYLPIYELRKSIPSSFVITLNIDDTGQGFFAAITVEKVAETSSENIVLHFVATESEIPENWQGQTELNFVERLMSPDENGAPLDFTDSNTQNVLLSFVLEDTWVWQHIEFVAFIQDLDTKEILQGTKLAFLAAFEEGPTADFTGEPVIGDYPLTVTFSDMSSEGSSQIVEYDWSFGDGGESTEQNPTYVYEEGGMYTVSLTVTDEYGLSSTETKEDFIHATGLVSDFSGTPVFGNPPLEVSFTDESIPEDYEVTGFHWDFGDGDESIEQNPVHIYEDEGVYTVSLAVTDASGASAIKTKANYITATYLPFSENILYISTTGSDEEGDGSIANPFATIQYGILVSADGDTILVHPGTYVENISLSSISITIGSIYLVTGDTGYISQTVIDGNQSGTVVTFNSGGAQWFPHIVGFTIQGGYATASGGGVYIGDSAEPTIDHCVIQNNVSEVRGGGFYCSSDSAAVLTHSIISGNSAAIGGGLCTYGKINIFDCLIVDNSSFGIVASNYGDVHVVNSTIAYNSETGIIASASFESMIIENTIVFYDNQALNMDPDDHRVQVSYSCIEGGWQGEGNISSAPDFVDPQERDLHLVFDSPCVDTGDNSAVVSETDLDGFQRIWDGNGDGDAIVDMGVFESDYTSAISIEIFHQVDWNLVGLPLEVEDASYGFLFPESIEGTLYSFDDGYISGSDLAPGEGYWLRFANAGSTAIDGTPINELTLSLNEDWNLVSGLSGDVSIYSVSDPDSVLVPGTLYGFNEGYVETDIIVPGYGYWLRAFQAGDITLTSGALAKTAPRDFSRKAKANSFTVNSTDLYFGIELSAREKLSYSLPPKPPSGAFDIRFSDDAKLCSSDECVIEVMSDGNPLTFDCNIKDGEVWELVPVISNETKWSAAIPMNGKKKITLDSDIEKLILRKSQSTTIPQKFVLHSAYPNPFNPITSLRYDLPEQAQVTLTIYDLMGRVVTQLVNTIQEGGYKSVQWNATDMHGRVVSAGVYLYQIRAGEFVQTRKMVLLK